MGNLKLELLRSTVIVFTIKLKYQLLHPFQNLYTPQLSQSKNEGGTSAGQSTEQIREYRAAGVPSTISGGKGGVWLTSAHGEIYFCTGAQRTNLLSTKIP